MKKILVIGESCVDIFVYCHAERLAPDVPVPVLRIVNEVESAGMASNVERNITAIYQHCDMITNPQWKGVKKTRYVHTTSNHTFIRVDTDHHIPRIEVHDMPLADYDLVVISDYNKGFLTEEDIEAICNRHETVFIDTKKVLGQWAAKAKFIKINNFEYERSKAHMPEVLEDKIICTKGDMGATFQGTIYPVAHKVEVKDTSGAGDSFFAALVVRYAETSDIAESITFANLCASKVVEQKGISVIERPA